MHILSDRLVPCLSASLLFGAVLGLTATRTMAWTASGTVKSASGTVLPDVAVLVQDSAAATVTNASGFFSFGSTTGVLLDMAPGASWNVRMADGKIRIRSPLEGTLQISLIDGSGRCLWSSSATVRNGTASAQLPGTLHSGAAFLRIRHSQGELVQAVAIGSRGIESASHLLLSRAVPGQDANGASLRASTIGFPVLWFKKSGYHDTSYAMTSSSATGLSIVLRDSVAAATCPTTALAAGDHVRSLTVKGATRSYILHVPSGYVGTSPVPLVVDFHPLGGSGQGELWASPYKAVTDPEGVVTAYPDGILSPTNLGAWNVGPCCTTADDTDFARAIVADAKAQTCIDPKRVYAVGYSMGGGMTHYSACHISDVFAAAAPAAFDLLKENQDGCKPSRPITMVLFRSTGDGVVLYNGGASEAVTGMPLTFLGAKASFAKWASINQCTGTPSAEDANGCSTYSTCADGVQVTLCTKQGGGHDYGNATIGWPILKRYTLP